MSTDPNEQAMLERLARVARGEKGDPYNPFEALPTAEEKFKAAEQYVALKAAQAARIIREQDFALTTEKQRHEHQMEEERVRLEAARVQLEIQKERQRIDLEYAQLEVRKADVIVRAIEAASKNPDAVHLVDVARAMSQKLLGGESLPALQIEDKGGPGEPDS